MDILPLFCDIDDFCLLFEPLWQRRLLETRQRNRPSALCLSEVMTIIVLFHASSYRNFKAYYTEQVMKHYAGAFPRLVSYGRFVELMPAALVPLCGYLQTPERALLRHLVRGLDLLEGLPQPAHPLAQSLRGVRQARQDERGLVLRLQAPPRHQRLRRTALPAADARQHRRPATRAGAGQGVIRQALRRQGLCLPAAVRGALRRRRAARHQAQDEDEEPAACRCSTRSCCGSGPSSRASMDQLKNISQIEHSRHRSVANCFVNLLGGLVAYTWREKKPQLEHPCQRAIATAGTGFLSSLTSNSR